MFVIPSLCLDFLLLLLLLLLLNRASLHSAHGQTRIDQGIQDNERGLFNIHRRRLFGLMLMNEVDE